MKSAKKTYYIFIFQIAVLTICLNACSSQNAYNKTPITSTDSILAKTNKEVIDTTVGLKYTSMVRSILEDSRGHFWFGSDQEGVCQYDGHSFTYYSIEDGLSSLQIRSIQEDVHGNIWFGTGNGICTYDVEKRTIHTHQEVLSIFDYVGGQWQKSPTDVWMGDGETRAGIYRYDGQNLAFLSFPVLDSDHVSFSIPGPVTGVSHRDKLWIASYSGVLGYDGKSFIFINEKGIEYHVRSIFEDSKGNLWIGNNGIGVLYYDGDTTINFTEKHGLQHERGQISGVISHKASLNHIFSITEDGNGNIWFADRDSGAWMFDGKSFTNYTTKNGLPNSFVRVVYTDKKGDVWLGMEGGGVCRFNGKSFDRI